MNRETLLKHLIYSPDTGAFLRPRRPGSVGRVASNGYLQICIEGKRYMAHRLAWLSVHGSWPDGQLDHINQDRLDNRIENLRVVSNKQNGENVRLFKHNTSGYRGVSRKPSGKWVADIKQNGKTIHLGLFSCKAQAAQVRKEAESVYFTHAPDYPQISPCSRQTLAGLAGSSQAPGTTDIICSFCD